MGLFRDWIEQVKADQPPPPPHPGSVKQPGRALVRQTRRLTCLVAVVAAGAIVRLIDHEHGLLLWIDLATLPVLAAAAATWIRVELNWRRNPYTGGRTS